MSNISNLGSQSERKQDEYQFKVQKVTGQKP